MKKIRVLSMLVTLVFLVSAISVSSVFAVDSSDSSGDNTLKQGVSEKLNYTFLSQVLNSTNVINETQVNETKLITYSANSLSQYLPNKAGVTEIGLIKDSYINVYAIDFTNVNGKRTILEYNSDGSSSVSEYDKQTGELIVENSKKQQQKYSKEQLAVTHQEMSPELQKEIDDYLKNGQIDKIKEIPGIKVAEGGNDTLIEIERDSIPALSSNSTSLLGVNTSYDTNYRAVTSDFPSYTKTQVATQTVYSDALANFNFADTKVYAKVLQSRNNYVRNTFDFTTFGIGVALTAIAVASGIGLVGVAAMLSNAGVLYGIVSGVNQLKEGFELVRDAKYTYYGDKSGYVYDRTTYNLNVRVYNNAATGTFDGGILPNGNWAWIDSPTSSAFGVANSTILSNTIYLYNSCINIYGYCQIYNP